MTEGLALPDPCVVVLVGPGASGKSTWAAANFAPDAVVSSDRLRALVGAGEDDVTARSCTAPAYLAACTDRVRVGALVTGITYRNVAHLGKIVATLDVLSGGRAVCGLGLGWFAQEHTAYGWEFPSTADRYALLEDALRLLPLLWGPGAPLVPRPGARGPRRRSATHGRCRTTYRSSRAVAVSGGPCVSRRATPTPPTSSATRRPWPTRRPSFGRTAEDADRDPADVALTHLSTTRSVGSASSPSRERARSWSGCPT